MKSVPFIKWGKGTLWAANHSLKNTTRRAHNFEKTYWYDRPKARTSDLFTSKDAGTVYSFNQELSSQQHNHVTDSVADKHLNL